MGHPAGGALRAARGLALALVVVGTASTAHLAGGGHLPPGLLLAGVVVAAAFAAHAATARRLTVPAAVALLGAGQVVLHAAFTVLAAPPGAGSGAAPSAGVLHVHAHGGPHSGLLLPVGAAADLAGPAGAADAAGVLVLDAVTPGAVAMLTAHVAATLACAVVLAAVDRSLWLLVAWLAPLVALLAAAAAAVVPRLRRRPVAAPRTRPRRLLMARRALRRGPPRLLLAPA